MPARRRVIFIKIDGMPQSSFRPLHAAYRAREARKAGKCMRDQDGFFRTEQYSFQLLWPFTVPGCFPDGALHGDV